MGGGGMAKVVNAHFPFLYVLPKFWYFQGYPQPAVFKFAMAFQ